jgi:hypothetical protein
LPLGLKGIDLPPPLEPVSALKSSIWLLMKELSHGSELARGRCKQKTTRITSKTSKTSKTLA